MREEGPEPGLFYVAGQSLGPGGEETFQTARGFPSSCWWIPNKINGGWQGAFSKHLSENTSHDVSKQMKFHIPACKYFPPAINESCDSTDPSLLSILYEVHK